MFLHVTKVTFLEEFRLAIEFNSGERALVDLENELYGTVFEPLRDLAFFRKGYVKPETGTVEWPNGADFAPEFLREIGKPLEQVA